MEKTDKKSLEEIIRVDHAGERGAIKIYEGQLLALKTFKQDEDLKKQIEEMKEHEKEHYDFFEKEIKKRNIMPTKFLQYVVLIIYVARVYFYAPIFCTTADNIW